MGKHRHRAVVQSARHIPNSGASASTVSVECRSRTHRTPGKRCPGGGFPGGRTGNEIGIYRQTSCPNSHGNQTMVSPSERGADTATEFMGVNGLQPLAPLFLKTGLSGCSGFNHRRKRKADPRFKVLDPGPMCSLLHSCERGESNVSR